jgi:hypothetical protein
MIKIQYTVKNLEQITLGLKALGKDANKAISRALNRTAESTRTQAVRAISVDMNIAPKRIRAVTGVSRAFPEKLRASVDAISKASGVRAALSKADRAGRIPLLEFQARGASRKSGFHYKLPSGKGFIREAFFAVMPPGGHFGVFSRLPGTVGPRSGREKIVELYGPSVTYVFRKHIKAALKTYAEDTLQKNLAHEISFLLSQRSTP